MEQVNVGNQLASEYAEISPLDYRKFTERVGHLVKLEEINLNLFNSLNMIIYSYVFKRFSISVWVLLSNAILSLRKNLAHRPLVARPGVVCARTRRLSGGYWSSL